MAQSNYRALTRTRGLGLPSTLCCDGRPGHTGNLWGTSHSNLLRGPKAICVRPIPWARRGSWV